MSNKQLEENLINAANALMEVDAKKAFETLVTMFVLATDKHKHEWVGLTDDEVDELIKIEQKLKEKNK